MTSEIETATLHKCQHNNGSAKNRRVPLFSIIHPRVGYYLLYFDPISRALPVKFVSSRQTEVEPHEGTWIKESRPKALSQDGSASALLAAAVTGSEARRDNPHSTRSSIMITILPPQRTTSPERRYVPHGPPKSAYLRSISTIFVGRREPPKSKTNNYCIFTPPRDGITR